MAPLSATTTAFGSRSKNALPALLVTEGPLNVCSRKTGRSETASSILDVGRRFLPHVGVPATHRGDEFAGWEDIAAAIGQRWTPESIGVPRIV